MWPPRAAMSSGWVRRSVFIAPVPPGWKLCFSSSPKAICLTVSVPFGTLGLALALGELEVELEHPAVPSRPAATVAPSQAAVRKLKTFTKPLVCDPSDGRGSAVERTDERPMTRRGSNSKSLVNARFTRRQMYCVHGHVPDCRDLTATMTAKMATRGALAGRSSHGEHRSRGGSRGRACGREPGTAPRRWHIRRHHHRGNPGHGRGARVHHCAGGLRRGHVAGVLDCRGVRRGPGRAHRRRPVAELGLHPGLAGLELADGQRVLPAAAGGGTRKSGRGL